MKTTLTLATSVTLLGAALLVPVCATAQKAAPAPPPAPTRVRAKLDGFDLSPKSGKSANQMGGASRDLGTPRLYAPAMAKAYSLTPTFYWGAPEGSPKVTFRLMTINGVKLYEATLTETHLTYPVEAPALVAGGMYRWTVIPENDMLGGAPAAVSFKIVADGERTEVSQALSKASHPAAVFVEHRIWYDGVDAYTKTLELIPDDQAALKGRGSLYDQVEVTYPLADADWKRVH